MMSYKYLAFLLAAIPAVVDAQGCTSAAEVAQGAGLTTLVEVITSLSEYQPAAPVLAAVTAEEALPEPFTVFAPTNDAFMEAGLDTSDPAAVFQVIATHVVAQDIMAADITGADGPVTVATLAGDYVTAEVNGTAVTISVYGSPEPPATVETADVAACLGTIHVIDRVLLPAPCDSVLDAIAKQPSLSLLYETAAAALSAEQIGLLDDPEQELTVLAPADSAFEAIADVVATLSPATVADVLLLHVVSARALAADLSDGQMLPTLLEGAMLEVGVAGGNVTFTPVDGETTATVIEADVPACSQNAALHIIDTVLLPPDNGGAPGAIEPAPAAGGTPAGEATTPGEEAPGVEGPPDGAAGLAAGVSLGLVGALAMLLV